MCKGKINHYVAAEKKKLNEEAWVYFVDSAEDF